MLSGVINIYKEKGFTSHDVVAIIKKTLGKVKVGHTGTLDPNAEGVLPICIGKATKISNYIVSSIKEYKVVLKLGITTDTQDITGRIIKTKDIKCLEDDIKKTILSFVGVYEQIPPMYSAIKIKGKKLYEFAREGKYIERKVRLVEIFNIKICKFLDINRIEMDVICSKGTYIRTLCNDIGEKLNVGGVMESLIRTRNGNFKVENSITISNFKKIYNNGELNKYIIPINKILSMCDKLKVVSNGNKYLYNGNEINIKYIEEKIIFKEGKKYLLYDSEEKLIGLYTFKGNYFLKPLVILKD